MSDFIKYNNWVHCLPCIDDCWFCKNLEAELDKWEWITHSNGQMVWKETTVYPISYWYSFMEQEEIDWIEKKENQDFMIELGFAIWCYDNEIYFFGLNTCNMTIEELYKNYWSPLYNKIYGGELEG